MPRISLATYTIRVQNRYGNENYDVSNFGDANDMLNVLRDYLNSLTRIKHLEDFSSLIRTKNLEFNGRNIFGLYEKGEYGIEAELRDIYHGNISYERQVDDAELIPYFFHIIVPRNSDEIILALQETGIFGIKTIFRYDFSLYFLERFPDFKVQFNRLVPEELIDGFLDGGIVRKIRFIKYDLPDDIADAMVYDHEENKGSMELIFKAKRGKQFEISQSIRDFFQNRGEIQTFMEIPDIDFEYDNVKIELKLDGGATRTLNLMEPGSILE